jgi:hypothetical protein
VLVSRGRFGDERDFADDVMQGQIVRVKALEAYEYGLLRLSMKAGAADAAVPSAPANRV